MPLEQEHVRSDEHAPQKLELVTASSSVRSLTGPAPAPSPAQRRVTVCAIQASDAAHAGRTREIAGSTRQNHEAGLVHRSSWLPCELGLDRPHSKSFDNPMRAGGQAQ